MEHKYVAIINMPPVLIGDTCVKEGACVMGCGDKIKGYCLGWTTFNEALQGRRCIYGLLMVKKIKVVGGKKTLWGDLLESTKDV